MTYKSLRTPGVRTDMKKSENMGTCVRSGPGRGAAAALVWEGSTEWVWDRAFQTMSPGGPS